MAAAIAWLNDWHPAWWQFMVAGVVQSTLVFLAVALAANPLRRASPAVRYWLWQLVPLKLLALPLVGWSLTLSWLPAEASKPREIPTPPAVARALPATRDPSPTTARTSAPSANPSPAETLQTRSWLLAAWCLVVGLLVARLAVQRVRLAQLLRACSDAEGTLLATVDAAARVLATPAPRVRVTALPCSPFVCGLVRPVLVVPDSVAQVLNADQLQMVLAHELAHLARRDLLWGWFGQLAAVLFFFHPVVHWANARIRLERELACDQWAMATCEAGHGRYAEMLVRVAEAMGIAQATPAAALGCDGGAGSLIASDPKAEREVSR